MKRPSFQFYPRDFMSDRNVVGMTNEEVGVYLKLLCFMWDTDDCSLPNDEGYLAKICRCDRLAIATLSPCFRVVKNSLRHKRLDAERLKQDEFNLAMSKAGKRGNEIRWGKPKLSPSDRKGIANDRSASSSSSSSSVNTTPIGVARKKPIDYKFYSFWERYPNKKGRVTALKSWSKLTSPEHEAILLALPEHVESDQWQRDDGRFIPHPATWLNQRRWEDQLESQASKGVVIS